MLDKVPETGNYAAFKADSLEIKDLAYLTAKTGDEFAILRGKDVDILFHGGRINCDFPDTLIDMLLNHKLIILAHSHPGEEYPLASIYDRRTLRKIGQKKSIVISGITGMCAEFGPDLVD